jgi:exopolysaccharide production protein ExoZ
MNVAIENRVARLEALDILRGFMAIGVMVYHFSEWGGFGGGEARGLLRALGLYCVDMFFVISGYTLCHVYGGARAVGSSDIAAFFIKRFFRIAPLYYMACLLEIAYRLAASMHVSPFEIAMNASLAGGALLPETALPVGGWSIFAELAYYVLFPPLMLLLHWRRSLGVIALAISLGLLGLTSLDYQAPLAPQFAQYAFFSNHMFYFVGGVVLREMKALLPPMSNRIAASLLAFASVIFICRALSLGEADSIAHVAPLSRIIYSGTLFLIVFAAATALAPPGYAGAALLGVGDASYSIYILHPFVYRVIDAVWAPLPAFAAPLCMALVLLVSWLTYRQFELRWMRRGRELAARTRLTLAGRTRVAS